MANVYLVKNKEQRVQSGHPWVFRSDIESVEGAHVPGGVVRVMSSRHKFLGMAVYNPQSQISLRMLSRRDESINSAFIRSITVNYTFDAGFLLIFAVLMLVSWIFEYGTELQKLSDETL